MQVTINNLTVNFGNSGAPKVNPFAALADGLAGVIVSLGAADSETNTEPPAVPLADRILEVLMDGTFKLRTLKAVSKAVEASQVQVADELRALEANGKVYTKRRRLDGETLFGATNEAFADREARGAAAETAETTAAHYSEMDTDDLVDALVDFLRSDNRYSARGRHAIAQHFEGLPAATVDQVIEAALADSRIEKITRRSDGAALYEAA